MEDAEVKVRQLFEKITKMYGAVPEHHRVLGENAPDVLLGYYQMRDAIFAEPPKGALPRKFKELVAMALLCARGVGEGAAQHAVSAIKAGATKGEVHEVLMLTLFLWGMPSYATAGITAFKAVEETLKKAGGHA